MYPSDSAVNVALIGAGMFGKSIVLQSWSIPSIRVCAIVDSRLEASIEAYAFAGIGKDQIAICQSAAEAGKALASGRFVVAVDAVQLIRTRRDISLHGGVFIVVRTNSKLAQDIMIPHNAISHPDREAAVLFRPYHLLGIEAVQSILEIGRQKTPTGAIDYLPRFDVVYRTKRKLPKDSIIGDDHSPDLAAEMIPGTTLSHDAPLSAGLASSNRLLRDVPSGTLITQADVRQPVSSVLWQLRAQQDAHYFGPASS